MPPTDRDIVEIPDTVLDSPHQLLPLLVKLGLVLSGSLAKDALKAARAAELDEYNARGQKGHERTRMGRFQEHL